MSMDFNKPATTDNYSTGFVPAITGAFGVLSMLLDPAFAGTLTNVPTGAKRLNAGSFEQWNGTSWAGMTINVTNATNATNATISAAVTMVSYSGTGSFALSWNSAGLSYYTPAVTIQPASGSITAVTFIGALAGNASTASLAANASLLAGAALSPTAGVANRVVQADASGYMSNTYFNSSDNSQGAGVTAIMVKAGDNFLRSGTAAAIAAFISGQAMNIAGSSTSCSGNAATASSVPYSGVTGRPVVTVATSGTPSGGSAGDFFFVY